MHTLLDRTKGRVGKEPMSGLGENEEISGLVGSGHFDMLTKVRGFSRTFS
jgi:hypothetical protein